ncbi:GNAT family N-acetyltransferase [Actinokineospora sp. HUAS TT18]|uniref:GNAT family N-acetyltransferase n=1 Tax=Actinokineospora sp. HUAS TT18 TaxID=3447451 RepID=UPI003F51E921
MSDVLAARIAQGQLTGLSRSKKVVPAGPFTGLLTEGGHPMMSYAVATQPGEPVTDLGDSLDVLRAAFPPGALRFELVEQACPGAAELLEAAGLKVTARVPLMVVDPATVTLPAPPDGVEVAVVATAADQAAGGAVAHHAFGAPGEPGPGSEPGPAEDGGSVVAWLHGQAVAIASWTQVAEGVTEIVGIATAAEHRRKGLATLATAHAVKAAQAAGATLTWLTPGDDGAERVYANVGFTKVADAIHLAEADA